MNLSPVTVTRVPLLLNSTNSLSNLTRTNLELYDVSNQLSSGRLINSPSEDSVRAAAIGVLDSRLFNSVQRERSLAHADTVLSRLDSSLTEAADLVREAQSLASSQIGVTSDAATRANQAQTVNAMIRQLYTLVNRSHDGSPQGVYIFGGDTANRAPLVEVAGGFRYIARGSGTNTDLGLADQLPITLGGNNALGETSARIRSTRNLNPQLWPGARLEDLRGARSVGIAPGSVNFSFSGSPAVGTVDLSQAQTAQDVATALTAAIRQYETTNGVSVLGPAGVTAGPTGLNFPVVAAGAPTLTFSDPAGGTTAADLGLTPGVFSNPVQTGWPLNPTLDWDTPLITLSGLSVPLGSIRARFAQSGSSTTIDINLAGATTLGELRSTIETAAPGLRLEINSVGTGINLVSEIAGPTLSIEEVPGGANTASQLGFRTLDLDTLIADFNDGRSVRIVDGVVNPVTGSVDPALNSDFRVTLNNGQYFDVDLRPQDITTVQTVINRINSQFAAAVGTQNNTAAPALAAGDFTAQLTTGVNGLAFSSAIAGPMRFNTLNNSAAAEDLGLSTLTLDGATSLYVAQDRAGVRVQNLFTDLIDLRDALLRNDNAAITQAGANLNRNADRLTGAQALVGTYAQRVDQALELLQDQRVSDSKTKSELQDVDYAEAATRLSQLQTQLEATLRTAGTIGRTSLFDFLS